MDLTKLPNDVLDLIYHKKHNLNMKDVVEEIETYWKDWETYKYDQCKMLLLSLNDDKLRKFYDSDYDIAKILTAMRNDGYLSTYSLGYKIDEMRNTVLERYNWDYDLLVIHKDYFIQDWDTTLDDIMKLYDKY